MDEKHTQTLEQPPGPITPPEGESLVKGDGQRTVRGIKWFLTVFAILSSTFLFALDTTVVSHTRNLSS
jgi:hypothetical protein